MGPAVIMKSCVCLPVVFISLAAIWDISGARKLHNDLHKVMTENEKGIYFSGEKPEDMNYEVIEILQPRLTEISRPQGEAESERLTRVRKSVEFSSHGEDFKLEMKPNTKLLAPYAMIVKRSSSEDLERLQNEEETCHYLHQDGETVAAFDLCDPDNLHGLVIQNNRRYEVIPLNSRLKRMLDLWKNGTKLNEEEKNTNSRESKSLEFVKRS